MLKGYCQNAVILSLDLIIISYNSPTLNDVYPKSNKVGFLEGCVLDLELIEEIEYVSLRPIFLPWCVWKPCEIKHISLKS